MVRIFAKQKEGWEWELWKEVNGARAAWEEMVKLRNWLGYQAVRIQRV